MSNSTRSTEDVAAGVARQVRALGRRIGNGTPEELIILTRLSAQAEKLLGDAVRQLRDHGTTDAEIGEALGITRQAVSKRWPGGGRYVGAAGRYRPSPTEDPQHPFRDPSYAGEVIPERGP